MCDQDVAVQHEGKRFSHTHVREQYKGTDFETIWGSPIRMYASLLRKK